MNEALNTLPLNPTELYDDPELYDLVMRPPDQEAEFEFCDALASGQNAPLLELGCGTGRLTVPLAARGHAVTGLDYSAAMLRLARVKAEAAGAKADFVQADFRNFSLGKKYGLILFPNNSLSHAYTFDDLLACFSCVRAHLAPGGMFVIDVTNPTPAQMGSDINVRQLVSSFFTSAGDKVEVYHAYNYDLATQIHQRALFVQQRGQESRVDFTTRVFFPQELDNLLRFAGFKILRKSGSYRMEPFTSASEKQIIVCSD